MKKVVISKMNNERSLAIVLKQALKKTSIKKKVTVTLQKLFLNTTIEYK